MVLPLNYIVEPKNFPEGRGVGNQARVPQESIGKILLGFAIRLTLGRVSLIAFSCVG